MDSNGAHDAHNGVVRERYRLCPTCGNFSPFGEKHTYCIVCGVKLIEECGRCREPIIYPTARFCPVCGAPLLVKNIITRNTKEPHPKNSTGAQ